MTLFANDADQLNELICYKGMVQYDADHLDMPVWCKGVVQFDIFSPKIWIIQMSRTDAKRIVQLDTFLQMIGIF